jgi:hypothetical protein
VGIHRSRVLLAADVKNCHHPIIAGQSTLDWRVATSPDSFKILLERNIRVPDWQLNSTQWRAICMTGVFQESVAWHTVTVAYFHNSVYCYLNHDRVSGVSGVLRQLR